MDVWEGVKKRSLDAGARAVSLRLQGMAEPRKRRQKQRGRESCSSSSCSGSSGDEMSTEDSPPAGSLDLRDIMMGIKAIRESQAEETRRIRRMLEDDKKERKEDRRTLEELKERINGIEKHLKKLNVYIAPNSLSERPNCSSGDISLAPRSELNRTQPPRFCLKITSEVNKKVETGKYIETNHGDFIEVNLYDGSNPIAPDHQLASAMIMMVVIKGKFNKDDNRYNWSKKEFKENIIEPEGRNSATGDRKHGIESIVSNCTFYLASGSHRHSGVTIVNNSGNKKVRLGVMVLSRTKERVLEGLSNHFLVRDPPKKLNKQRKAHGNGQEQNGPSSPTIRTQKAGNGINMVPEQLPPTANMDYQHGEDIRHSVQTIDNQQLCSVAGWNCQPTEVAYLPPIPSPIGSQRPAW